MPTHTSRPWSRAPRWSRRRGGAVVAGIACTLLLGLAVPTAGAVASLNAPLGVKSSASTPYPDGVFDLKEPSLLAPPTYNALPGYARTYVDDFTAPLGKGWFYFNGVPGGDPGGRFNPQHVDVAGGALRIGTWRDPRFGNEWVSGGAGLIGVQTLYGAYFVRSRELNPGPETVELLWPIAKVWPPEIDFNDASYQSNETWWFLHYDTPQDQASGSVKLNIQQWHTWGVIWSPTSIIFTVDGHAWGEVTNQSEIPHIPMQLDLQSQAWCGVPGFTCPTQDSLLQVDWVAVYTPTS